MSKDKESGQDQMPEETSPSYEELEARAAALRRALEDVWSVCSEAHWPQVGKALEADAGKRLLDELEKTRYERDLLRRAIRPLTDALDRHDHEVLLSRSFLDQIPDADEDCIETGLRLGTLREARDGLQAVEATPEKVGRMTATLEAIESYGKELPHFEEPEKERAHVLRVLTREIPQEARRALTPVNLPEASSIVVDETLAEARRYEKALREIAARAEDFSDDQPEHELLHALMVELPQDAIEALHPLDCREVHDADPDQEDQNGDSEIELPF